MPVVIVEHISQGFDGGLAPWLDGLSPLTIGLADDGTALRGREAGIAPCDRHVTISAVDRTGPARLEPADGWPSAFRKGPVSLGRHALAVILTGMGEDGAGGLVDLHDAGGTELAQDEASCWSTGYPPRRVARGVVHQMLALDAMADGILATLGPRRAAAA